MYIVRNIDGRFYLFLHDKPIRDKTTTYFISHKEGVGIRIGYELEERFEDLKWFDEPVKVELKIVEQ